MQKPPKHAQRMQEKKINSKIVFGWFWRLHTHTHTHTSTWSHVSEFIDWMRRFIRQQEFQIVKNIALGELFHECFFFFYVFISWSKMNLLRCILVLGEVSLDEKRNFFSVFFSCRCLAFDKNEEISIQSFCRFAGERSFHFIAIRINCN